MIPFPTTAEQLSKLPSVVAAMTKAGLASEFIAKAVTLARTDQGVFDLMALWFETSDAVERDEIVADIAASIVDYDRGCDRMHRGPS